MGEAVQQLIITLTPAGQVNGPIGNKLLRYGLLEMAKDAIRNYEPEAPPILLANGLVPKGLPLR